MKGEKIRLFVDAHVFDGIPQGTITFLTGIYAELSKDSRFQLYIGSDNRATVEKLFGNNNFIHIEYHTNSSLKRLLFIIPKVLKQNKIDFAHFQYISPIQKKCKYIVRVHDLLFLEFPKNFPLTYRIKNLIFFYLSSKRADIITTVSNYSKESIHRFFNIPLNKIELTPNAVASIDIDPIPIEKLENKKFILYVSRIEPRKNQALLIEIWQELGLMNENINLVLVGADGLKDRQFNQQITLLNEKEKQHFYWLTKVPTQNLIWLYQNCSLFVFPSSAEGFGIPPIEAAINGAKVICSNTTAMRDFDFFEDFSFSPIDKLELKKQIINTLNCEYPHEAIKNKIIERYNWKVVSRNFASKIIEKHNEK